MSGQAIRYSIVVPTYNRPRSLQRCIAAIEKLSYPQEQFEVLIVDDGSSPPVTAMPDPVKVLRQNQGGPARARNLGLRSARGEFVVFTDDDCRPSAEWLSAYDRVFSNEPCCAAGGPVIDGGRNGIFAEASQMLISYLYESSEAGFFCSNNLAFPRAALLEIGGFDESFPTAAGEDREVCARWAQKYPLRFAEGAIVHHDQDLSAASFWRQQVRYGRGAALFSDRTSARLRVRPFKFYARMLAYPFQRSSSLRALPLSILLGVSQIASAAGYLRQVKSSR